SAPSHCTARMVQLLIDAPSTCTTHAPHWLVSQPTWVPVRPSFSRNSWTSSVRSSTSAETLRPFTVKATLGIDGPPLHAAGAIAARVVFLEDGEGVRQVLPYAGTRSRRAAGAACQRRRNARLRYVASAPRGWAGSSRIGTQPTLASCAT